MLNIVGVEEEFNFYNYIDEDDRVIYDHKIFNTTDPEPFEEEQPIPRIIQLTNSGLLQIGWDRRMTPFDDFKQIENTKVALRLEEYNETTDGHYWRNLAQINEQQNRRNLHRSWEWNENEKSVPEFLLTA